MFQGQPLRLNNSGTFYVKHSSIVRMAFFLGTIMSESEY